MIRYNIRYAFSVVDMADDTTPMPFDTPACLHAAAADTLRCRPAFLYGHTVYVLVTIRVIRHYHVYGYYAYASRARYDLSHFLQ